MIMVVSDGIRMMEEIIDVRSSRGSLLDVEVQFTDGKWDTVPRNYVIILTDEESTFILGDVEENNRDIEDRIQKTIANIDRANSVTRIEQK